MQNNSTLELIFLILAPMVLCEIIRIGLDRHLNNCIIQCYKYLSNNNNVIKSFILLFIGQI